MDPTEDFTWWSQLLIDSLKLQIDYVSYISDSTELLFSILDIGELPDPIKIFTKSFLDLVIPQSVKLLLEIPQKIEEELDINMGFLSAVLNVGAWAAQNKKSDVYQIIPLILDKNNKFYTYHPDNSDTDQWKSIVDLFFDCGTSSMIFDLLNDTSSSLLNNILCILKIIVVCSSYREDLLEEPKNQIIDFFNNRFTTLQNPTELKLLDEKLLDHTFKIFILCAISNKWNLNLTSFFEFIYYTFKSEILEKQIFASTFLYNFLIKISNNTNFLSQFKNWCEQSNFIQFLVGKDFNENVLPYLYSIFQYFSKSKLLPSNIIELLWQRILQVHISQKERYISIIIKVMQFMPLNDVRFFFEKVTMNDNLYSDEVLKLVSLSAVFLSSMSTQLASLLFRKSLINEKVKTALFESVNNAMPLTTRKYIGDLCFGLIEEKMTADNKPQDEENQTKSEQKKDNENKIEQKSDNDNHGIQKVDNENIIEQKSENDDQITQKVNNENKIEQKSENDSQSIQKVDNENKIEQKSENDDQSTQKVNNENKIEQKSENGDQSTQKVNNENIIEQKSENENQSIQKVEVDNNSYDDHCFLIVKSLLRKIISTFSPLDLRYMSDFEERLIGCLSYNRSAIFELIAQYDIKMTKTVTTELFHIFSCILDDPLWSFFLQIFRSLGKNATTRQAFELFPTIIGKYDFHHATISFSSFIKAYLLLSNLKEGKIKPKDPQSNEILPTQFFFTRPPVIGTDILFKLLSEANDNEVSKYVNDVLFCFLTNFSDKKEVDLLGTIHDKLLPIIVSNDSSNELKRRYLNLLYMIITNSEKATHLEDFGFESHSIYRSQRVIVTIKDKKFKKRFLCDKTDTVRQLTQRLKNVTSTSSTLYLSYKNSSAEDSAALNFYDIVNNEMTFHILLCVGNINLKVPDLSKLPSIFLTNERFQQYLFKLIKVEELFDITNKILDYLPNEHSVVEMTLDPSKVIEVINDNNEDFYFVQYCLQTLVDQLILGDYETIIENYVNFKFIDKLILYCKENKEKSEKVLYEILRIFFFLITENDESCSNDLIELLFNAIVNSNDENTILSAAYLYKKIVLMFPDTDAIINNLELYEKVIIKTNKDEWQIILDSSKSLKNLSPIFEMTLQKIEQINLINYQHFVDLFTLLIPIVPTDIVTNDVFDKCVSILIHEKGQTFISLCEVAISIIDSNNIELNSINPEIITQLISRALHCDSSTEQKASFNLCTSLIEKFPSCLDNIHKIFSELFKNPSKFWNYSPSQIEKKIIGYAGLTNLGATCYMNSVFQQLFNCIQFRDLLFQEEGKQETIEKVDDNGKSQIFNIFVNMLFGKKGYIDTNDFCRTFKGWGKQLINTHEQQDAVEFMILFLDQLPEDLQRPFKGTFIHKITDVNDSYCSSNEENFFALSIDIKHFTTIEESFNSFLKYELFTGENQIFSDTLGTKIDAKKYTRIKVAPPNLVLHLKRFEYSRSTFNYIKIKSRFEVPQTIDISPLLEDEKETNTKYTLKGVVLHEGNANSGHYISLVKHKETWIKCNDKNLSIFNFNDFMEETFGGQSSSFCAYLLFYSLDVNDEISIQEEFDLLSPSLKNKIENENHQFLEQQSIFSKNMVYLASHIQSTEIMTDYFINIFTHSSNGDDSYVISERLKENIHKNQKEKWLINYILSNFDDKIKPIYLNCDSNVIISSLNELIESTFQSLNKDDVLPLAEIFVRSFVDSLAWRNFHHLLTVPLRFIKHFKIVEKEDWRCSISKKIEDFYQTLISEVVLEEVDFSPAFRILQRITPTGLNSKLVTLSNRKKILESMTNYSSYFNFVVVTKQSYQIDSIFKFYSSMTKQKFNSIKFIRLVINVLSYSDFDASSMIFKFHFSINSIDVASMLLYYLRTMKPNLKEALVKHFRNCVCPLLIDFNSEVFALGVQILQEIFDTVTFPSNLQFKDKKPSAATKWISKAQKEKLKEQIAIEKLKEKTESSEKLKEKVELESSENLEKNLNESTDTIESFEKVLNESSENLEKVSNAELPSGMLVVIDQMDLFVKEELIPKISHYSFWMRSFLATYRALLTMTKDFKVEHFNTILDLFNSCKEKSNDFEFCYENLLITLNIFPPEVTKVAGPQYLKSIFYNTKNSIHNNSKLKLFLSAVLKSSDEVFKAYFETPENYEFFKNLFLFYDYEEADECIMKIINFNNEKINDFKEVYTYPTSLKNYKKINSLLKSEADISLEIIQILLTDFFKNITHYEIIYKLIPSLLIKINKVEDFPNLEIPDDAFNRFLYLLQRRFSSSKNQQEDLDTLWEFTKLIMNKIPHFKKIFCDNIRFQLKSNLIFRYFDFVLQFEKNEFESEVTEFLEILSKYPIEKVAPEFNQKIVEFVKKIENLEILNNYFVTILSHNDIYESNELEEMARIILSKINDEQIGEAILLLSSQFDTKYQFICLSGYKRIFSALSLICEMKPNFSEQIISSIPFKKQIWPTWDFSERAKNILISQIP